MPGDNGLAPLLREWQEIKDKKRECLIRDLFPKQLFVYITMKCIIYECMHKIHSEKKRNFKFVEFIWLFDFLTFILLYYLHICILRLGMCVCYKPVIPEWDTLSPSSRIKIPPCSISLKSVL